MIKPTKGLSPIYVHYYDKEAATIYNLTKEQYDTLLSQDNGIDVSERFEVEQENELGYVPPEVSTLSKIYGFDVESE